MTNDPAPLNADQLARADAALDAWYTNPDGSDYRAPGVTWGSDQLHKMHAALEAPDVDAALRAFGAVPGTWLTSPELDAENRALMTQLRHHLGIDGAVDNRPSGAGHDDVTALIAMSNPRPPSARAWRASSAPTTRPGTQDVRAPNRISDRRPRYERSTR